MTRYLRMVREDSNVAFMFVPRLNDSVSVYHDIGGVFMQVSDNMPRADAEEMALDLAEQGFDAELQ